MTSNKYYIMSALTWQPGFFCTYQSVIGFLNFVEQEKPVGFKIFLEMGLYFDQKVGSNWWEYYFEPVIFGEPKEGDDIEICADMQKSHWGTEAISTMTKERANEIINKYIKVKSELQLKMDKFYDENFNHYVIGIHYRGTDKSSEAPRVGFDVVESAVNKELLMQPNAKIFIATDEKLFLNYMKKKFGDKIIYIDAHRSSDNEPIHHKNGNPVSNTYKLGEEAVMDCYLLSRTNIMIRTQSNLSSSAANINPLLPVINLNTAHYRAGLR